MVASGLATAELQRGTELGSGTCPLSCVTAAETPADATKDDKSDREGRGFMDKPGLPLNQPLGQMMFASSGHVEAEWAEERALQDAVPDRADNGSWDPSWLRS